MAITISGIPVGIRTPGAYVNINNVRANQGPAIQPIKILVLGQALAGGSAPALTPTLIGSTAQGTAAFGLGSMLDKSLKALIGCNSTTPLYAMAVPAPVGGVAATYTVTVTAAPTAAGTLALYIGGELVSVGVGASDTIATVATNIAAAVNALTDLPVTAASAAGVVTLTLRWVGLTGNSLDIRTNYYASDVLPTGLALTIAAGVAGAGVPAIGAVIAAFGDTQWNHIVCPWTDGATLAALATEMANRRGPLEMIEGLVYCSAKGSQGTLAALGATLNSPDTTLSECVGPATPWERASREAGTIAFYGAIDPALPFKTLALVGDYGASPAERFTRAQRDVLLHDGISTHRLDHGGNVLLERPITTYQVNAAGLADPSYLDVTTMLTLSYLRYSLRSMIDTKYARFKLAANGTPIAPGQSIVTPATLSAELVVLALQWQDAGLVQNVDEFKHLLIVQIDAADPTRVDALIPPDIIPGFMIFAADVQFAF